MLSDKMALIADVMVNKEIIKQAEKEIVAHGLKIGAQLLLNILTTVIVGFAFSLVLESLIFIISFSFVRTYAGGYHCKKVTSCYFFSSGVVVAVLVAVRYTPMRYIPIITVLMLLASLTTLLKLAPVETATKQLDEVEKIVFRKKMNKHLSIECSVMLILSMLKLYTFYYVICLGISVSGILVFIGHEQTEWNNKIKGGDYYV